MWLVTEPCGLVCVFFTYFFIFWAAGRFNTDLDLTKVLTPPLPPSPSPSLPNGNLTYQCSPTQCPR